MGMWYWRPLKSSWVVDEATTNRFDLPDQGYLSGLYLQLRAINATGNYAYDNGWPFQRTDLKIVGNGNVEIVDLRGRQLQAVNFWESGEMPKDVLWDDINGTIIQYAYIPFGRYLGDLEYGLILDKFGTGVQFEETNTFSTTYYTDAYSKYDVWGLFRKNPESGTFSKGYFSKKQIINKDTASEEEYDVKLPTTNRLKQIYIFTEPDLSSTPATVPFTNLSSIWLSVKSKEDYILREASADIFARAIHQMYGRKAYTHGITKVHASNANYFDTMIYERENTQLTPMGTTTALMAIENSSTFWERICRAYCYNNDGTGVSAYVYVSSEGILYHGLIPLLSQDPIPMNENDMLDAKAEKDVYVSFTEGASTGNIYIVLDELQKSYPI